MNEYETEVTLHARESAGEPGPRVPLFEPTGRLPKVSQLASLAGLAHALASGQTDAQRIALTAQYAARVNALDGAQ